MESCTTTQNDEWFLLLEDDMKLVRPGSDVKPHLDGWLEQEHQELQYTV